MALHQRWTRLAQLAARPASCEDLCGGVHMATNLDLAPELLEEALRVSGESTKKAAVTRALEEFIARRRQKRILELFGRLDWDPGYDYKAGRTRR